MKETKQIVKILLLPMLFLAFLAACEDDNPFLKKPNSMENTAWAHLYPSGQGDVLIYYFKPSAEYLLRDEYTVSEPEVVTDSNGKPIVIKYPVLEIDPLTGEQIEVFYERDSIVYVSKRKADTLDIGIYEYEYEAGAFKLASMEIDEEGNLLKDEKGNYVAIKDEEGNPIESDGYFNNGFIYIGGSLGGSYQRIK